MVAGEMLTHPAFGRRLVLWTRLAFAAAGLSSGILLTSSSMPWAVALAGAFLIFSLLLPFRKTGYGDCRSRGRCRAEIRPVNFVDGGKVIHRTKKNRRLDDMGEPKPG